MRPCNAAEKATDSTAPSSGADGTDSGTMRSQPGPAQWVPRWHRGGKLNRDRPLRSRMQIGTSRAEALETKRRAAAAVTNRPLHVIKPEKDTIAIRIPNGSARIVNPLDMIGWKVPALTSRAHAETQARRSRPAGAPTTSRWKFICRRFRHACKAKGPVARFVLSLSAGS
jgi:hypothetical protein